MSQALQGLIKDMETIQAAGVSAGYTDLPFSGKKPVWTLQS